MKICRSNQWYCSQDRVFEMDLREPSRVNSSQPPGLMVGPPHPFGAPTAVPSPGNNSIMPPSSAGMMQGMTLSFNNVSTSTIPKPTLDTTGSLYQEDGMSGMREPGLFNMGEQVKKKRGRPRKYGPDGGMALALSPLSTNTGYSNSPVSDPAAKRRGRPPGSRKKQQLEALGSAGTAFTPHLITVQPGEDVSSKILAFSQQGPRTVCVLSANGAISDVILRQPASSGGTVTYEDRFEIISLSGSFLLTDDASTRSRTGGLSVALAGSDGRILGGGVAGMLKAATPVQVILGSFIAQGKKPKIEASKQEPSSALNQMPGFTAAASQLSEGTSSGSSDDPGSPLNQSGSNCNISSQFIQPMYPSLSWAHSANQARHDADLKVMPN